MQPNKRRVTRTDRVNTFVMVYVFNNNEFNEVKARDWYQSGSFSIIYVGGKIFHCLRSFSSCQVKQETLNNRFSKAERQWKQG